MDDAKLARLLSRLTDQISTIIVGKQSQGKDCVACLQAHRQGDCLASRTDEIMRRMRSAPAMSLLALLALSLPITAMAKKHPHAGAAAAHGPRHAPKPKAYGHRADAMQLAVALAQRHALDPIWVKAQLAQAKYQPSVARLMMPPPVGVAKNWAAYRARFIEPDRVRAGAAFWVTHEAWLDAAERRWGVPAELVVGIIGVETFYGRVTGNYRVLDALATLSLDFPKGRSDRSEFFRSELGEFLKLARAKNLPTTEVKGSYAGAIGLGQFMPGSINRYAVDFDADGRVDMGGIGPGAAADVIGSVANYLAEHGWQRGVPSHFDVKPPSGSADRAALLQPDILPSFTSAQMVELGALLDGHALSHDGLLALVELQNGDAAPSHIAGTQNFYAVTRYNHSAYYALAVIELGRAVAATRSPTR